MVIHAVHTVKPYSDKAHDQRVAELYTGFRRLLVLLVFINEE